MNSYLTNFEDRIQRFVEGSFARLFAGRLHPREVAIQLARAMEDKAIRDDNGRRLAPDLYTIRLHPLDHTALLEAEPGIAASLARELEDLGAMSGYTTPHPPEVRLLADADVALCDIQITAESRDAKHDTTQSSAMDVQSSEPSTIPEASLILNSREVVLTGPLVTLGRQHDNQIILDDPSVSRHHAQIRVRFGRFVLFDLGSTMGTKVNGKSITETILQHGDLIAIGTETLIYTEAIAGNHDNPGAETETFAPLNP